MLRLPRFHLLEPASLREASQMLADQGPKAMAVAGGTDIYPKMKRRQFSPSTLVNLRGLDELRGISGDANRGLRIGAGTSLTLVSHSEAIIQGYPGLAQAAGSVSTPILRNMGTIGGNLCLDTRCNYYDQSHHWRAGIGWCMKAPGEQGWPITQAAAPTKSGIPCRVAPGSPRCWAVSSTDSAPMLIALGADLRLVGPDGERTIPAAELYRDDGMFYLGKRHEELIAEIILPPANGQRSGYWKLRRRGSFDFPVLGVAVSLGLAGDRSIERASIVLGGVGSAPQRMEEASERLIGERPSSELFEAVAELVYKPARPLDNTDYHLFYRKRMARLYVRRALEQLTAA